MTNIFTTLPRSLLRWLSVQPSSVQPETSSTSFAASTLPQSRLIHHCVHRLQTGYRLVFGNHYANEIASLGQVGAFTLRQLANSDAAYHNLEHTVIVTLVGHEILCGKHRCREEISAQEWFNFIVSLLCHDIGYVKGVCRGDRPEQHLYVTGIDQETVSLSPTATGASLAPYHVARGKRFIQEQFADHPLIDVAWIQHNIELTRFPVPLDALYQDTLSYAGLTRAADLIGQLGDPSYLAKLPALYQEFEEVGGGQAKGYCCPQALRRSYPKFYWHVVYPYLRHGIRYLQTSDEGQATLAALYDNLTTVESEMILPFQC